MMAMEVSQRRAFKEFNDLFDVHSLYLEPLLISTGYLEIV